MSDFDSRQDSKPTKSEQIPPLMVKLSFTEFSDWKLNGLQSLLQDWIWAQFMYSK